MNNTKQRSAEIYAAAVTALTESGADITDAVEILPIAKTVAARTGCHIDTAKRATAKAVRRARFASLPDEQQEEINSWGGSRPNSGPPNGNKNASRIKNHPA
jgi:hypothetical protein